MLQDARFFEPRASPGRRERVDSISKKRAAGNCSPTSRTWAAIWSRWQWKRRFAEFRTVDAPAHFAVDQQEHQFNLTTRRRTEAQVQAVIADGECFGFTVRLADRFGDHGLISWVIGECRARKWRSTPG